jgi:hypothetical protein
LSAVEESQRRGDLDRCILVVFESGIIATDFVTLVVEVLEKVREIFRRAFELDQP